MGKEEKKASSSPPRNNLSQAGPGTEQRKEPEAAPMSKKPPKRDPGAGQEEDAHKCCGCRFPLLVALLQLALGASVTVLGFLMASISSSVLGRDTPYWAGLILCVVAVLGLVMLCISYQPDEKTCVQFAIKVTYFLLSALSLVVCVLAVAFAAYCYSQITQLTCETISETCQCKLDTEDPLSRTFIYQDISDCPNFLGTFSLYLLIQIVLNLLAAFVGLAACFVMWKDRYQVFYVGIWLYGSTVPGVQQQKV
ncbi:PREDICTED: sarcospan [Gekko japonicus]|uniref:Sarcospan n=1 Tax=Gekko japonicus TaxID=146911 RepID=A0ABM1LG50_GEKJA|nr:PREDICTED: sarcospan [Gekko japonicus]